MLYVNVYLVSQVYGGPEEGGWYYDVGEPMGSTPIKTKLERGKSYYVTSDTEGCGRRAKVTGVKINVRECDQCHGTGEYQKEAEEWEYPAGEEAPVYTVPCDACRELPEDLEATGKLMVEMYALFEEHAGRYQHIAVALEDHFAAPYPDKRPHYE